LTIAETFQGKTTAKVAIASKDPQVILAGMGAYTAQWSIGAVSFTLFAYGSREDAESGVGFNRGRIFWNDEGPITVDICTAYAAAEGVEICTGQDSYTVDNR
jgi:hypothetical protein